MYYLPFIYIFYSLTIFDLVLQQRICNKSRINLLADGPKKRCTDPVETSFLQVSSELSSYLRNSQNTTSNASDVEAFEKWISCELGKLPEMNKRQKIKKITQIIFS